MGASRTIDKTLGLKPAPPSRHSREKREPSLACFGPNIVSPDYLSTAKNTDINAEALRLGLKVTDLSRTVGGQRLTDEQFHRYRATTGQLTAHGFEQLLATPAWRELGDEKRRKAFDDLKTESRKTAWETLGLIEKMKATPRRGRAPAAPPRDASAQLSPSAVPPLPVGFELER